MFTHTQIFLLLSAPQMSRPLLDQMQRKKRRQDTVAHAGQTDSSSTAEGVPLGILHLLLVLGWLKRLGNGQGQYLRVSLEKIIDFSVRLEKIIAQTKDYLHCTQKVRLASVRNLLLNQILNCTDTQRYHCSLMNSQDFLVILNYITQDTQADCRFSSSVN